MNRVVSPPKKLLAVLGGAVQEPPPIWLMRQAGRYLPEYRELRARAPSFLDFCYTPKLAAEATLQPIRRFGFDAAILFSDILVAPDALGQTVSFETGEGPRLAPIETPADLSRLKSEADMTRVEPVFETVERVRASLAGEAALIGFCGAPWTVASYMIAGRGTPDQAPARLFAYRHRAAFQALIDLLIDFSAEYLLRQSRPELRLSRFSIPGPASCRAPNSNAGAQRLSPQSCPRVRARAPDAAIIAFPRGAGAALGKIAGVTGLSAIGLDTVASAAAAASLLPPRLALQGNLDPIALLAGGASLDEGIDHVLADFAGRPHVFNLGHGILPETPIENVERLVRRVRGA